jgi:hypothetical protein
VLTRLEDRTVPASFVVTTTADSGVGSLRDAISQANANSEADTISFAPGVTKVTLTSAELPLTTTNLVTINGGPGGVTITRDDTASAFRILNVSVNAKADLVGLTLTNGKATGSDLAGYGGGLGVDTGATVTLTNITVSGNTANFGGGIASRGKLTMTNTTVSGNTANYGGGIASEGILTLTNSTLSGNTANNDGGGIAIDGGTVTVTNATMTANRADADGNSSGNGGGMAFLAGAVTLFNTIVAGNFVGQGTTVENINGAIDGASQNNFTSGDAKLGPLANNGGPTLTHALLAGSPAIDAGNNAKIPAGITTDQSGLARIVGGTVDIGAMEFVGSTPVSLVVDNSGDGVDGNYGPGQLTLREAVEIANGRTGADTITFTWGLTTSTLSLGELLLTDTAGTTINGGTSGVTITRDGMANAFRILNVPVNAKADLVGLTIQNGSETNAGGILNAGILTVTNSTISNNVAELEGGGIRNTGTVTFTNSSISGNKANYGAGILTVGTAKFTEVMISNNDSKGAGGIYNTGTLTLSNSTMSGNKASDFAGAISNVDGGVLTITGSQIQSNTARGAGGIYNAVATMTITKSQISGNISTQYEGGGVYNGQTAKLTITESSITKNTTAASGGGIYNESTLDISDSEVKTNTATIQGGGLHNLESLTITNSAIEGNIATEGNAGGILNSGTITATKCSVSGNQAALEGGGIRNTGSVTITNSTLNDNFSFQFGGAISNRSSMALTNSTLSGNKTQAEGGGIYNLGTMSLVDSSLNGNTATNGGAITNDSTTVTLVNVVLSGNTATSQGGGFYNLLGTAKLTNTTVAGNTAAVGGGIYLNKGTVTLTGTTVSKNDSVSDGGGIFLDAGTFTINNSTISGNKTQAAGGGIFSFRSGAELKLTQSTVTGNRAGDQGGGIHLDAGTASINNTIIAGNFKGTGTSISDIALLSGSIIEANHNLIGDAGSSGLTNGSNGNIVGVDVSTVLNTTLANNGGSTFTHALLGGSPAINAGNNSKIPSGTTTDQRGLVRIVDGTVDIGAFEFSGPVLLGYPEFGVGTGVGSGQVNHYDRTAKLLFTTEPFEGFTGGIRTAASDFNGDGVADLVAGTGPGRSSSLRIYDGVTQKILFAMDPFEPSFKGGIYVATGDLTGDGTPDFVISPDEGGGPRVRVFNGKTFTQIADFFGIDDPNFRGGARAALSDLNNDGKADLLVAAGFGGGPRLALYNGATLTSNGGPKFVGDFFVFEQTLRNGVFLTAGDVNGDGYADVMVGGGPGGGPRVFGLSGKDLTTTGTQTQVANFFAGDPNSRGGVRLTMKNLDNDTFSDIVIGYGTGAGSRVIGYRGVQVPTNGTPASIAFDYNAFPGFSNGVFVG